MVPRQIAPIVQSHIGIDPGKLTVDAPMKTPLPIPLIANRPASRFGLRFVVSTRIKATAPRAKEVQASGGVFGW